MKTILIVEDEEPIRELVKLNLSMVGFDTLEAEDGEKALEIIKTKALDLVVLDIMIPKINGYELLPHIIERDIPVILLTAMDSLKDKVKGLNLGADDYITKPFEGMELIARINALFRRSDKEDSIKKFDNIEIHEDKRRVFKDGEEVELTPKEFELLKLLVDNKGIALSREKILELIWKYEYEGNTRTVDMHIQRLRHKLDTDRIKTVYKIGYRLE
ncbi:response regulator transcription factor [Haloimpatiens lingqiaonensis]|uniref:response regulator transcription factor n=1 Tax=Haloimpatiens lingqiaonensis TaxID=1380675 RepID=UPI0010FDC98F|nr:response regulator transcription factor [Haloimpatiens lingqiaonensis]